MLETFTRRLEFAQPIEEQVLRVVKVKYPQAKLCKGLMPEYDIWISEIKRGVEVKCTMMQGYVGIKYERNYQPAGIAVSKAAYFAIAFRSLKHQGLYKFIFITIDELKTILKTCFSRTWVRDDQVRVYMIPIFKLERLNTKFYAINNDPKKS